MAEDPCDAPALRLGHVQTALRAAPQDVIRGSRPFLVDEIAQLALGESRAEVFAQAAVANDFIGARSMAAKNGAQGRRRDLRVPCKECISQSDAGLTAEIAAGKRRAMGPWSLELREVRPQPLKDSLGQVPVRGDLAAEDRKHRRCASVVVYP